MAFKVRICVFPNSFSVVSSMKVLHLQSFGELNHRPLLVDLTVEEQTRLKVIYGSADGFHAVDLDSASVYDIYLPKHVSSVAQQTHRFAFISSCKCKFFIFFFFTRRLKDQSLHTASSPCRTRMAWICFCVTTMKACMSTRWDAFRRILFFNGAKCRLQLLILELDRLWAGAIKLLRWVFFLLTALLFNSIMNHFFPRHADTFSWNGTLRRCFHA